MLFNRKPKGRITRPSDGDAVPRRFRAQGTVSRLPDDQHLLLVVQVSGLMWPKGDVPVVDGAWSTEVHEEGSPPGGRFHLALYRVGARGYEEVVAWLDRGQATDSYPGLRRIEGGVRLHRIRLRLRSR